MHLEKYEFLSKYFKEDNIIFHNGLSINYTDISSLSWKDTRVSVNGMPVIRKTNLSIILSLDKKKYIFQKDLDIRPFVIALNIFKSGQKTKKIKEHNRLYIYELYYIKNRIVKIIFPKQYKDLLNKVNSGVEYSFSGLQGRGGILKKANMIGKSVEFSFQDIVKCEIERGSVFLTVLIHNKVKDIFLGTIETVPDVHMIQIISHSDFFKNQLMSNCTV